MPCLQRETAALSWLEWWVWGRFCLCKSQHCAILLCVLKLHLYFCSCTVHLLLHQRKEQFWWLLKVRAQTQMSFESQRTNFITYQNPAGGQTVWEVQLMKPSSQSAGISNKIVERHQVLSMQRIGKILDRDLQFTQKNHLKNSTFWNHPQGIKDVGIFLFFYYLYTRVCPELLTSLEKCAMWHQNKQQKHRLYIDLAQWQIKNTLFGQKHMIKSHPAGIFLWCPSSTCRGFK